MESAMNARMKNKKAVVVGAGQIPDASFRWGG
jgi:hypothetical protein